ncbi:MAG: IPTL-CTERM sorting domain-containing protein [Deltaproteobacteria bacterium]|nr:IPTL-CTERM sorting domain-containing protein [Deltaproteobacteria bacterium]
MYSGGTTTSFAGTIIANTSITINNGVTLSGRALALTGAVTLDSSSITVCSLTPTPGAPTLSKAFNPATINAGGVSTLTITLSNPNTSLATLSVPLIDTLPPGVVIASTPNANSTCGGMTASAGGNTVTLTGSIPAGSGSTAGTCQATVNVTSASAGTYINTLVAGALQTNHGSNTVGAIATLTVVPPITPTTATTVPTLSEWGMIIFMVFGGFMSIYYLRRQRR